MNFIGNHFKYASISSKKYNLIFANVNTSYDNRICGEIETNSIFIKNSKKKYFLRDNYENAPISLDAEVVTDNDSVLDYRTQRAIEKWLFYQQDYSRLYIDDDECEQNTSEQINGKTVRTYLNCRLTMPEKIEGNGGVVGYKFRIECDSCMLWQDPVEYSFMFKNSGTIARNTCSVLVDSDLNDYVYPKITIRTGNTGGDISIVNSSVEPDRVTSFSGLSPNTNITMIGEDINYISGDNYYKFSDKNFLRLYDGNNIINISGDVINIYFEFQNRRFL